MVSLKKRRRWFTLRGAKLAEALARDAGACYGACDFIRRGNYTLRGAWRASGAFGHMVWLECVLRTGMAPHDLLNPEPSFSNAEDLCRVTRATTTFDWRLGEWHVAWQSSADIIRAWFPDPKVFLPEE